MQVNYGDVLSSRVLTSSIVSWRKSPIVAILHYCLFAIRNPQVSICGMKVEITSFLVHYYCVHLPLLNLHFTNDSMALEHYKFQSLNPINYMANLAIPSCQKRVPLLEWLCMGKSNTPKHSKELHCNNRLQSGAHDYIQESEPCACSAIRSWNRPAVYLYTVTFSLNFTMVQQQPCYDQIVLLPSSVYYYYFLLMLRRWPRKLAEFESTECMYSCAEIKWWRKRFSLYVSQWL